MLRKRPVKKPVKKLTKPKKVVTVPAIAQVIERLLASRGVQLTPDLKYLFEIKDTDLTESSAVVSIGEKAMGEFQSTFTEYWCMSQGFLRAASNARRGARLAISGQAFLDDLPVLLCSGDGYERIDVSTEADWMPGAPDPSTPGFFGRGLHGRLIGVSFGIAEPRGGTARGFTWYQSAASAPAEYVVGEGSAELVFDLPPSPPDGEAWYTAVVLPKT